MNYYDYNSITSTANTLEGVAVWAIVSLILAIIGGVLVYFLFIKNKHLKLTPFLKNLRDLLDFKVMILETILKILYLIITIFVILVSFSFIAVNFLTFLLVLIFGPIIVRIIYEASMMLIMIWKNTKIIADNTTPKETKKEEKKENKKKEIKEEED